MKVLIFSTFIIWRYHYSIALEIAKQHQDNGDDVHFLLCESSMHSCELNTHNNYKSCQECILKRENGLDLIMLPAVKKHYLNLSRYYKNYSLPYFENIYQLKEFTIDGVDVGSAVASSLISLHREPEPDTSLEQEIIKKLINNSMAIYNSSLNILEEIKPDIFYLYNGRFSTARPALRAGQKIGIKTMVHGKSGSVNSYYLNENTYSQDLEYTKGQIEKVWQENPDFDKKQKTASQWFSEKRNACDDGWSSFTRKQIKNALPENFDPKKRNIAIFNSSQDEREAIAIWKDTFYRHQNEAINSIVSSIKDPDIHFYLRVHPNLNKIDNSQTRGIKEMNYPNLTIIPPDSEVHTYTLMEACEKIISFGSTMGVESVFWGKASVLVGRAFYEDLGICYIPGNYQETLETVRKKLTPKNKEGALKFAYWEKTRGTKFKYYKLERSGQGNMDFEDQFMGQKILPVLNPETKKELLAIISEEANKNNPKTNLLDFLEILENYQIWDKEEKSFIQNKKAETILNIERYKNSGDNSQKFFYYYYMIIRYPQNNLEENVLKVKDIYHKFNPEERKSLETAYSNIMFIMAKKLLSSSRFKEAREYIDKSLDIIINLPDLLFFKGICLDKTGEKEKAKAVYKQALEIIKSDKYNYPENINSQKEKLIPLLERQIKSLS